MATAFTLDTTDILQPTVWKPGAEGADEFCVPPIVSVVSEITSIDSPFTVSFTSTLTEGTTTGLTYLWDFGDSTGTSTAANPSYTYPGGSGTYTVTLTVTNECGEFTATVVVEGRAGLLDPWSTGLMGAVGFLVLRGNYYGPVLRLRRAVAPFDESDFDFVNDYQSYAPVDWAAITAWLAGDTGQIINFYDQSGNSNDVIRGVNGDNLFNVNIVGEHAVITGTGGSVNVIRFTNPLTLGVSKLTMTMWLDGGLNIEEGQLNRLYGLGNTTAPGTKAAWLAYQGGVTDWEVGTQESNAGNKLTLRYDDATPQSRNQFMTRWDRAEPESIRFIIDGAVVASTLTVNDQELTDTFDQQYVSFGSLYGADSVLAANFRGFAFWEGGLTDDEMIAASAAVIAGG